jgi:hypothetical protein
VPVCASFESILGLSTVLLGFAPADGRFHAPNEWMWMSNYETGIRTIARYWDEVSMAGAVEASGAGSDENRASAESTTPNG